jgi:hypothetical protein
MAQVLTHEAQELTCGWANAAPSRCGVTSESLVLIVF